VNVSISDATQRDAQPLRGNRLWIGLPEQWWLRFWQKLTRSKLLFLSNTPFTRGSIHEAHI